VVAAAALLLALPASASALPLSCSSQTMTPVFAPWGDPALYRPVDGGTFESQSTSWTLSGSRRVAGNDPYDIAGDDGGFSLAMPAGSTATSPPVCVSLLSPTLRFMVRSTGSPFGSLWVSAKLPDGSTVPLGGVSGLLGVWRPSLPMILTTALLGNLTGDSTDVRFRFAVAGGSFAVDDVFVDPYGRG
jgi:hypothetical protein